MNAILASRMRTGAPSFIWNFTSEIVPMTWSADAVGFFRPRRMNSMLPPDTMKVLKPLARRWASSSCIGW